MKAAAKALREAVEARKTADKARKTADKARKTADKAEMKAAAKVEEAAVKAEKVAAKPAPAKTKSAPAKTKPTARPTAKPATKLIEGFTITKEFIRNAAMGKHRCKYGLNKEDIMKVLQETGFSTETPAIDRETLQNHLTVIVNTWSNLHPEVGK